MDQPNGAQKALWTFLGYTLVGPFFAALGVAVVAMVATLFGIPLPLADGAVNAGFIGAATFVWSALPAGLAGLAMAFMVWRTGSIGTLSAAIAGVLAFAVVFFFSNMPHREYFVVLAFFAGLVSLAVRAALQAGGIIGPSEQD